MERMTLIVPRSKSISPHFKPNISLCRNPVEAARRTNVRSRSARPSISALISAGTKWPAVFGVWRSDERSRLGCGQTAQTSETATHQDLLCECFVAYIRVASYPPTPPLRRRRIFRHRAEGQGWRNQSSELLVRLTFKPLVDSGRRNQTFFSSITPASLQASCA